MIKYANLVLIFGIVLSLFPFSTWFFFITRLIWGIGAGAMTVFVPKFIHEFSPMEMSGFVGGFSQFMVTFGILVPSLLALAVPADLNPTLDSYDFYVNTYWRISWLVAVVLAFIQLILIQFVFKWDTPEFLKETGKTQELNEVMNKIYIADAVNRRTERIVVRGAAEEEGGPSMWESFTDPNYRASTFIGCLIMALQQLSGICVLVFYSATIFEQIGQSGAVGAAITNFANMCGAIGGVTMLAFFGRKIMLVTATFFMATAMILMGNAYIHAEKCVDPAVDCPAASSEVIYCVAFVVFFEFGMGVIPWLYMAEIMTNTGMAAGVATNQTFTLLVSLLTLPMLDALGGWTFILFGVLSILVSKLCLLTRVGQHLLDDLHEGDQRPQRSSAQGALQA